MSTTLVWPMLNGSDVRCLNLRLRRKKLTVWTYRLSGCWIMETCLDWDLLVSKIHLCDGLKIFVCIEPACCASWECPKHVVECLTQLLLHLLMCFVSNHFSFASVTLLPQYCHHRVQGLLLLSCKYIYEGITLCWNLFLYFTNKPYTELLTFWNTSFTFLLFADPHHGKYASDLLSQIF